MIITDYNTIHKKSEPVNSISEAKELLVKLNDEFKLHTSAVGLAAIQIGIAKQIAIIKYKNHDITIINPIIREVHDEFVNMEEQCLSLPKCCVNTLRYKSIIIDNTVIDSNSFRVETQYYYFEDNPVDQMLCIAVQHEIDHMDGKCIIDKLSLPTYHIPKKIGRNEMCPCKSGKKFKKCCGK